MNNFRCILIVLVLVKSVFCSEEDILKHINCKNQMYNRSSTGCCISATGEESVYKRSQEFCCGNKVYPKQESFRCCTHEEREKSKRYKIRKEICCNGQVLTRLDKTNTVCCGNAAYNQNSHKCIGNSILLINEGLCNGNKYNLHENHCCNGELTGQRKKIGTECCGHKLMITNSQICCDGEIKFPDNDTQCCGKKVIKNSMSCCNGSEYNPALHGCKDGKITSSSFSKCFLIPYNSKTQVCCKYSIINKTEDNQDSCCQGSSRTKIPYDSETQKCTDKGNIRNKDDCDYDKDPKKFTCCQGLLYNKPSNESMCCGNIQKQKPAEGIPDDCQASLCDNKMYNGIHNICCNGTLISRTKYYCKDGKQLKLFNFKDGLYTKNIQICGQYAIKRSRIVGCCIGMPYFKDKIKCPLKWRDKRSELKSSDYPFWNIIHCKTLSMTGTILHVKPISQNKFTIHFESDRKNYEVKIHIRNSSKKHELVTNNGNKKIYVFYEKISGNKIILGTFGAISFVKNHSIKKINKTKCQYFENYRKEMNI
ncbi:galaxin isoform X1 [Octopus bimaculoides]|uniref:Galaxin-like repeats domain-containing protein n=1 Tax=Octopus bimaculoides TaxID=37653 RepID=A0A0L8H3L0_OCTBM|nr:galaxin isoform X1 [Octopus bimaculoides]|eukprot:XP_014775667.1 PREDICTED: galaxin-like [Octopus bimaculoides]